MKKIIFLYAILIAIGLGGCSGAKMANLQIINEQKFTSVDVKCDNNKKVNKKLEVAIKKELQKQEIKLGNDLQIKCAFDKYDEGNRFLRWLIGMGAGRGKSNAQFKLYDANSSEVASFEISDFINGGFFGGKVDFVNETAKEAVKVIKEKFVE